MPLLFWNSFYLFNIVDYLVKREIQRLKVRLKEHAIHLLLQGAHTPAFKTAHIGVKLSSQLRLLIQDNFKMRPAQLSPQRRDNLKIRKSLYKVETML